MAFSPRCPQHPDLEQLVIYALNHLHLTMKERTASSGSVGDEKCSIAAWEFSVTFRNTLCRDSVQRSNVSPWPFTTTHSIIKPLKAITAFKMRPKETCKHIHMLKPVDSLQHFATVSWFNSSNTTEETFYSILWPQKEVPRINPLRISLMLLCFPPPVYLPTFSHSVHETSMFYGLAIIHQRGPEGNQNRNSWTWSSAPTIGNEEFQLLGYNTVPSSKRQQHHCDNLKSNIHGTSICSLCIAQPSQWHVHVLCNIKS